LHRLSGQLQGGQVLFMIIDCKFFSNSFTSTFRHARSQLGARFVDSRWWVFFPRSRKDFAPRGSGHTQPLALQRPGDQLILSSAVGSHCARRCPAAPCLNNRGCVNACLRHYLQGHLRNIFRASGRPSIFCLPECKKKHARGSTFVARVAPLRAY